MEFILILHFVQVFNFCTVWKCARRVE